MIRFGRTRRRTIGVGAHFGLFVTLLACCSTGLGQTWQWSSETIDNTPGIFSSIVVDKHGNLHVAYSNDYGVTYGFRAAHDSRWYTVRIDPKSGFTRIALDREGNPHMCLTTGSMKYAYWNGRKFVVQEIAPGTGHIGYSCSVAVSPDGTPHVTWYRVAAADNSTFAHLKYAVLRDGVWQARTLDFEMQTGKFHSLDVDGNGNPHVSYDSWVLGLQKYAYFDGQQWAFKVVEARTKAYNVGMGNDLVLDSQGRAHISYYDSSGVKYAIQQGDSFKVETVASYVSLRTWRSWRTSLVLDGSGHPHICYEDGGSIRHAFWDGSEWHSQLIVPASSDMLRYSAMAIGPDNVLYVIYRDPIDSSIKLATGRIKLAAVSGTGLQSVLPKPGDR